MDLRQRFPEEIKALEGSLKPQSSSHSCMFFTMHRCGSVFAGAIIKKLTSCLGLTHVNFEEFKFLGGLRRSYQYDLEKDTDKLFRDKGFYYGAFRNLHNYIPSDISNYKIILQLRDPRDVMVSQYFCSAYSHYIPDKENPQIAMQMHVLREALLTATIDDFVLQNVDSRLKKYHLYHEKIINKTNVSFLKYEDMVFNFDNWLHNIIDFLNIDVPENLLKDIRDSANFEVKEENIFVHKRSVLPGDFRRKLKSVSVKQLNDKCRDVLSLYGYVL
jgi:sulfotransferase family protein